MRRINRIYVAAVGWLTYRFGLLYARHRLNWLRSMAADMRENIASEQLAIAEFEREAKDIEITLLHRDLAACREKSAVIEGKLRQIGGAP